MNFNIFEGTSIMFKLLALLVLTALIQVIVFDGQEGKTTPSAILGGVIVFTPNLIISGISNVLSLFVALVMLLLNIIGKILKAISNIFK